MRAKIRSIVHNILVRVFPSYMGYHIKPRGLGYFSANYVVKQAARNGLSITDYLETFNLGGVGKRRDEIIAKLEQLKVLPACTRIVEIGAGTGMYLEKFIEKCNPEFYEVYETNTGWARYLKKAFSTKTNILVHNAKGDSLHDTADNSTDIVSAHGVFVYLPVITTFQYLKDAARVCKENGLIMFDIFSDRIFTVAGILTFREKNPDYDFPVIIKEQTIEEYCAMFNLKKLHSFDVTYHYTKSTYFVLQKMK